MANASTLEAPLKTGEQKTTVVKTKEQLVLEQEFDVNKKYMFELLSKNIEREMPVMEVQGNRSVVMKHQPFKPYQNIVFTSQVVWNGNRRMLRYYDGCTSIFQDEQPKEKDVIDQLIHQSKQRAFLEGKFGCFGDERMLLLYLNICSWNGESEFKTRTSDTIFIPTNADKVAKAEEKRLDLIEEAMGLARNATSTKMRIHSAFLGIADRDYDSGNELDEKAIRTKYRQAASRNPEQFIESFGNKSIEVKYYIDKALEKGIITNKFNPNKATWGTNNTVICDISGLKSHEAIAQALFEFSSSEVGEEFVIQLKAISE